MLRHWSQFVPNMSADIRGHEALYQEMLCCLAGIRLKSKHNGVNFQADLFVSSQLMKTILCFYKTEKFKEKQQVDFKTSQIFGTTAFFGGGGGGISYN